jgi:HemY protein
MFQVIWYLVKILIFMGLIVGAISLQGQSVIAWNDYKLTTQTGYLVAGSLILLFLLLGLYSFIVTLITWPSRLKEKSKEKKRQKGMQHLLKSLSASAAQDAKHAYYHAVKAKQFLPPSDQGLAVLLQAHSARLSGQTQNAQHAFEELAQSDDTVLLGSQGLIQNSILKGDYDEALRLAQQSSQKYPKNYHLLRPVYELQLRKKVWSDALSTLQKLRKYHVLKNEEGLENERSLWLLIADTIPADCTDPVLMRNRLKSLEKAYKCDKKFAPSVEKLASCYHQFHKDSSAISLIKSFWRQENVTGDVLRVAKLYHSLAPKKFQNSPATLYKWALQLAELDQKSPKFETYLFLSHVATEQGLFGEARTYLAKAEKIAPRQSVYQGWIKLEEKSENRHAVIRQWQDRKDKAEADRTWVCTKTARIFQEWQGVVEPDGFFNSLVWIQPMGAPILQKLASPAAASLLP